MSRSGYSDDVENWSLIRWRGQVTSAIRGKRGQSFLKELLDALDALPEKRLIKNKLRADGEVCALGAVGVKRGTNMEEFDPEDYDSLANVFGIAPQLVQEIEFINDEQFYDGTPEERWTWMRAWVQEKLKTSSTVDKE